MSVHSNKPQLTLLSTLMPYPPLAAGAVHVMDVIRQLTRFYGVRLHTMTDTAESIRWGPLAEWCEETNAWKRGPVHSFAVDPPAVQLAYSAALVEYLRNAWATDQPDIVQLEWTDMAQYAALARHTGALVVCTAHTLGTLSQIRRARMERNRRVRLRRWLGAMSLWMYEARALRHCHLIVSLGTADTAVLRRWLPRTQIVHIPSGIDLIRWRPVLDEATEDRVLFVGNYLHPPNLEGGMWLAREVWPLVRRVYPKARLILAGRTPPPALQALAAADIEVPGTVDDLHPLYARASVVVSPIFWGSGIRFKLLEAFACGLPVVTTAMAAEGIPLQEGHNALFAERPQEFAAAIVRLLENPPLRRQIGAAARALVERDYDWDRIGERLHTIYEDARSRL